MDFYDEMQAIFQQVINAQIEPHDWKEWWNKHESQLRQTLSSGDFLRIKPRQRNWENNDDFMIMSQTGIVRYFKKQGIDVAPSSLYEEKTKQKRHQQEQIALFEYDSRIQPIQQRWDEYCYQHQEKMIEFDCQQYLGILPIHKDFSHPKYHHQESLNLFQQRIKENLKYKIIPLIKANDMKIVDERTFVKEDNDMITFISFIDCFYGGYADVQFYRCPLYALGLEKMDLPRNIYYTKNYKDMQKDWQLIEYIHQNMSVRDIDREFDNILRFFAEDVFPSWNQIDSLDTYFCNERKEYLETMLVGPPNLKHPRILPLWDDTAQDDNPWGLHDYLYGVWDLLCGNEESGYKHLKDCLKHEKSFLQLSQESKDSHYEKDYRVVLYRNAHCFLDTQFYFDINKRKQAIKDTYNEICEFMRYYHCLKKKSK